MITSFDDLLKVARERGPKTVAVAVAQDSDVLKAVDGARAQGIVKAILVGDKTEIEARASEVGVDLSEYEIIDIADMADASLKAVELVSSGKAQMVMKGLVDTAVILKAVLNKEVGLRTGNVLSHVALFDVPKYHKLLLVTDAAMNIAPDLQAKKQIIENSLQVAYALDIEVPNVGVICAKEKVNPKMPATVDAGELVAMNERGELTGCVVGGPFALDNAVSKEAAKLKKIDHPAAGDCDILLAPNIEGGNILYKTLGFLTDARSAGVIVGAKAPVILTSRADSDDAKLNSIALGVLMAAK
ncbi:MULTISPECIES: phosphate butyryltransferase [unclassified Fusibacter]|uniref:phosphate butyryltransferase n=1 Tax=unclassified Fusibacter TaxID=2624464 RepID=UPI001010A42D|nr:MULTISPECIES: phosphate butyryltransferase [unclassified Fusibacter]MCK8059483.1 phosphate butyryltransferase [Fusibacter sp. A2]NPE21053.1 phosphate butyryltransferase [Fusibacter sp. A1]RXV62328.1 phosphate butyryltransferase [Fusibacter sp. A1]